MESVEWRYYRQVNNNVKKWKCPFIKAKAGKLNFL